MLSITAPRGREGGGRGEWVWAGRGMRGREINGCCRRTGDKQQEGRGVRERVIGRERQRERPDDDRLDGQGRKEVRKEGEREGDRVYVPALLSMEPPGLMWVKVTSKVLLGSEG